MKTTLRFILTMAVFMTAACAEQNQQGQVANLDIKATNGVIYGKDSVRNITEEKIHGSEKFRRNLKASAALVLDSQITINNDATVALNDETVEEKYRTCPDFKMSEQISAAFCSGILIAPDKILTAAHCLSEEEGASCENTSVVFGYSAELNKEDVKKMSQKQVYHCQKLMETNNYNDQSEVDYAVIKLDRPVEGIEPVVIVKSDLPAQHRIQLGDAIYTVGYPIGTPKKLARGKIRRLHQDHNNPQASLDVYYGNSGSPIFNTATNELVGLLSNGEQDFVMTSRQCQEPKRCSDNGCLGEAIVPVNKILEKIDPKTLAN